MTSLRVPSRAGFRVDAAPCVCHNADVSTVDTAVEGVSVRRMVACMAQQTVRIRAHWNSRSVSVNGETLAASEAETATGFECPFEWGSVCDGARQLAAALLLKLRPAEVSDRRIDEVAQGIGQFPYGNFDVVMSVDALLTRLGETSPGE